MTRRLAVLLVLLGLSIGAVVVPKLYWDWRLVTMTCGDMEHAIAILEEVEDAMSSSAGVHCMPGEPQCIAESWMTFEAIDLRLFIEGMHHVSCRSV